MRPGGFGKKEWIVNDRPPRSQDVFPESVPSEMVLPESVLPKLSKDLQMLMDDGLIHKDLGAIDPLRWLPSSKLHANHLSKIRSYELPQSAARVEPHEN